ncbi:hypothetical protein BX616_002639 [Lobosporangium transversale]|uniref:Uncharacterized protein n=1 Tax=Lobosporangium transversale TaxID=64571 RepID=A0A1Y2G8V5_9FUNG|nr:hypothetical protein BCR41DRAFT_425935 [Lobosporangium transversale]KAF9916850.1 hypothetical protein BX616_002639 [Lobosporangium transversale]ORZ04433.1 hypothetical protein BCR41DRAFT_425935 [Lobosporangium transversale]|eukprot:XP_021876541.1 hypothetical protein BCR41DRAFT_425935 [Lobosporangium transversale]
MDCNWCAVCSKHFHCEHQASLYCSDECREADALACCNFHDCDHPDGSAQHDHLTFCHHHRPAIRIPSLPLLNSNPNPLAEKKAFGQQQTDGWTRFLQQQYNGLYHSHSTQTSLLHTMDVGYGGSHHHRQQHGNSHGHGHHYQPQSSASHSHCTRVHNNNNSNFQQRLYQTHGNSREFREQLQQQQQQALKQLHQYHHKTVFYSHTRHASMTAIEIPTVSSVSSEDADCLVTSLANLSLSKEQNMLPSPCGSFSSSSSNLSLPCQIKDCEQPCVIRKNKTLPPPTLSHILPMTISNPASLSPTRVVTTIRPTSQKSGRSQTNHKGVLDSRSCASSSVFSFSGSNGNDNDDNDQVKDREEDRNVDPLSHAWPKMDKFFFFPDHCCRTSTCLTATNCSIRTKSNNKKPGNKGNKSNKENKRAMFVSELPPPPVSARSYRDTDDCIALKASIWGAGWRQVEPLPEPLMRACQKNNLLWAGCERDHHHHHHRNHGHKNRGNDGNLGRRKSASDASSWTPTDCSCRLPRSLQFID